ncbi:hypothetical protein XENOCAPTIV_015098 [Xenoophorus captivus]|uniref:Uncharacterized protein n=1 Tax=Xenoophorus captivus TaxID=1517983 RepID=A0ABV0QID7_9TELE
MMVRIHLQSIGKVIHQRRQTGESQDGDEGKWKLGEKKSGVSSVGIKSGPPAQVVDVKRPFLILIRTKLSIHILQCAVPINFLKNPLGGAVATQVIIHIGEINLKTHHLFPSLAYIV